MKITIEIPDWAQERDLYLFAGIELLGTKAAAQEKFLMKVNRCNFCGKCCQKLPKSYHQPNNDGVCVHLKREGAHLICDMLLERPWLCSISDPVLRRYVNIDPKECSITYKEVEIK